MNIKQLLIKQASEYGEKPAIVFAEREITFAQLKDETALDWAWLSTNETGEWTNFTPVGWWDSNWIYRKEIIINHNKVTSNLHNFPVLIS